MPLEIDYSDLHVHKLMLHDGIRCAAFRRALAELVTPDSAVLDVGAGTSLLSVFAAQSGARIVYAVERTQTAELAERIVSDNRLSDRIRVIKEDMESVELPEQVDVIVSEWLGGYGIDENLLPVIVRARDRWLKPGGIMIPSTVSSWIAPAYDAELEKDIQFWTQEPYGVDLAAIAEKTSGHLLCCRNNVKAEHLLADPQQMWEIDCTAVTFEQAAGIFEAKLDFTCTKQARCNALAAWFEAHLSKDNVLSNRPSDQWTHWGRWVFPIGACLDVDEGSRIAVHFSVKPEGAGRSRAIWQVNIGDYSFSSEDVTSLTR
ncbi:MAG TPA: 50S ribosomal protein L11 methyltransferase [Armatimonadota bacterium]|nr:50S ribosomal protein L11 methyltransferase [Armatimonadota bacterium]